MAEYETALRSLWRELADKDIEQGVDWPYIARTLFADLDRLQAEAHDLEHEVDRVRERLWRLAALTGWRSGNPADNDATAELYVTEALKTCVFPPGES
ncbi:MAG TPA: hypothetical protein VFH56_14200 [Acidimicrobiales bacterium]|nr:hypothetical protein [Acidimicrobiales bacterium]